MALEFDFTEEGSLRMQGTFEDLQMGQLLLWLFHEKQTGELYLETPEYQQRVFFSQGYPTGTRGGPGEDYLGWLLMERSYINDATYFKSLELMSEKSQLQGQILIELNAITPAQLNAALRLQLQRKIIRLFKETTCSFLFMSMENPPFQDVPPEATNPYALVSHGLRQSYDRARLEALIEPTSGSAIRLIPPERRDISIDILELEGREIAALPLLEDWTTPFLFSTAEYLEPTESFVLVSLLFLADLLDLEPLSAHSKVLNAERRRGRSQAPSAENLTSAQAPSPLADTGSPQPAQRTSYARPATQDALPAIDEQTGPQSAISRDQLTAAKTNPEPETKTDPQMNAYGSSENHATPTPSANPTSRTPNHPPTPGVLSMGPPPAETPTVISMGPPPAETPAVISMGPPPAETPAVISMGPPPSTPSSGSMDAISSFPPRQSMPSSPSRSMSSVRIPPRRPESSPSLTPLPSSTPTRDLTQEEIEKRGIIKSKHDSLKEATHYDLLELTKKATEQEIRAAYRKLSRVFHPDLVAGTPLEELKKDLDLIFSRLNEAHSILTKKESREEYDQTMLDPETAELHKYATQAAQAEVFYTKAMVFMKMRDYDAALEQLHWACELMPAEGDYLASRAWAMYSNPKTNKAEKYEEVIKLLEEAEKNGASSEKINLQLGQIYKEHGNIKTAMRHFKEVLMINPRHPEATRELRYFKIQNQKQPEKKGLFGRFKK